jgi:fructose-1,6-bisphosphatase/inositol monophosphatase family enzyme
MVDESKLVELGIKALEIAHKVHEELGDKGLEPVQKNPHGETSLVGDIEAEKAVIDTFKEANIPLRIISEEHGQVDLSDNPEFLAVLDGLDGTSVYKTARGKGRYGTMFGIFSNLNPSYEDYIFGGVMEHSSKKLYYAVKNKGGFLVEKGKQSPLKCSTKCSLDDSTRIYVDFEFDKGRNTTIIQDVYLSKLKGHNLLREKSSAIHYVDFAHDKSDLVLECTRKGNLEIAVAFVLVNEAGGVIVTIDGTSIGKKKYLTLGQDEYIPIISASTMELARELIKKIR